MLLKLFPLNLQAVHNKLPKTTGIYFYRLNFDFYLLKLFFILKSYF